MHIIGDRDVDNGSTNQIPGGGVMVDVPSAGRTTDPEPRETGGYFTP